MLNCTDESSNIDDNDMYRAKKSEKLSELKAQYNDLSVDESLDYLATIARTRLSADHYVIILEKILACNENAHERLIRLLHSFSVYLQGKEWSYEKYDLIIVPLLSNLGQDGFWSLAESISAQLSDYDYQTSARNMQLLLKLKCQENLEEMESLFLEELRAQQMWVTGNGHFDIRYDLEKTTPSFADTPRSLLDMTFYILLEQADTQNARKIEIAIYAIYLLGQQFPQIMSLITERWSTLSKNQEECLLIVISKWAIEGICSNELHGFLLNVYNSCSELSKKYYLHSILIKLHEPSVGANVVSCTASVKEPLLPQEGIADDESCYENFISLIERYKGKTDADAIRKYIFEISPLESYKEDRFGEDGDSKIPVINSLPETIFYSMEKNGEWASIPLAKKKARLLSPEDPFILTQMPQMVFDNEWFPEVLSTCDGNKKQELTLSNLHDIVHSHVGEEELVLAANLWYPWGYKDGVIYTEISKIDLPIKMHRNKQLDVCLGNFGLLANEEAIEESCYSAIGTGGLSLFNRVCGSFKLYFGNCQLAPSSVWKERFDCNPQEDNPYIWIDNKGQEILRFELIASPVREVMREPYIRQPLLFRWICNKAWLQDVLQSEHLCLYPFCTQEQYPCFSE